MALFDSTFIRYSLVGLLNTGITLGTVFLLMFLNVHYLLQMVLVIWLEH